MSKKISYTFLTVLFISLIISFNCTEKGVECGLGGTWELVDYEYEYEDYLDEIEGTLIIYSNDTYDLDMKYSVDNNGEKREYKESDTGTLKACNINKLIQFFSKKDNDNDMDFRYNLNWNTLILENDKYDLKITYRRSN